MRSGEGGGFDDRDVVAGEGGFGGGDGAVDVDGAARIADDGGGESAAAGVEGGEADAEVVGEAGEKEAFDSALAAVGGESGRCDVVVLEEDGVGVALGAVSLAQDQLGLGQMEGGVEFGSVGALDAVIGPEALLAARRDNDVVGLRSEVGGSEGDVTGGVPVLREDDVLEPRGDALDEWDDGVALGYGQ